MATRILFLGDIFSDAGRRLVSKRLPALIGEFGLDLCLANAENASGGVGLTAESARELLDDGLDALSGGNHTFKWRDLAPVLEGDPRVIRPGNFPDPCPGRGWTLLETPAGVKVGFGNLMGRVYMQGGLECPFRACDRMVEAMGAAGADITLIDIHAEATSEKAALAWKMDGRLGALLGTHTHVQTNDARIWPGGLAFMTDVGMTGPHQSIIGMRPEECLEFFLTGRHQRFHPAKHRPLLQGAVLEFGDDFKAVSITPLSLEGFGGEP
jgi:metallophosphoesterase (TIGR00282 family)